MPGTACVAKSSISVSIAAGTRVPSGISIRHAYPGSITLLCDETCRLVFDEEIDCCATAGEYAAAIANRIRNVSRIRFIYEILNHKISYNNLILKNND
jgi:hypothetical protein